MTKRQLTLEGRLKKIQARLDADDARETIPEIGGGLWVDEVYVGTANYGVYYTGDFITDPRYIDGVPTWVTVNTGINPADGLIGLRGDPWEPGVRQYVLMTTGLYRRVAPGNWVSILTLAQAVTLAGNPPGPNSFGSDVLETSINRRGHVAVLLNCLGAGPTWASFYIVSYDYGATWTAYNMIGWGVNGMACHNLTIGAYQGSSPYDAGQVMYTIGRATANTDIFVSLDGGQTWASGSQIGGSVYYCDVLVDPSDQSRVYIGLHDGVGPWHVAVSEDHGATWTDIDAGAVDTSMGAQQIWYMLSKAMDERRTVRVGHVTIFAPTFHMTRDEGISWDEPAPEYAGRTFGVSLVQDAPDYLYLLLTSSPLIGTPHVIYASLDECRDMVPKAGANANVAVTGGGDSIPYDCGGIRGILQVWTTPNRHGVNSHEHDGTLDGMSGLLSTPQTPTPHNVLSAYHGDTLAAGVVRGDVVVGNATPAWARVAVGGARAVLRSDGTDPSWMIIPSSTFDFMQVDVAANQAAVALDVLGLVGNTEIVVPYPGSVLAISIASNAARTAGTLTVDVTVNGVATGLQAVLDGVNPQYHYATQNPGLDAFVAGDRIGVDITTDAAWLPVTADIVVKVIVEL